MREEFSGYLDPIRRVSDETISSSSDIFNILTDGDTRLDSKTLKNMDDLSTEKVEIFWMFAMKKNLKFKTSKFIRGCGIRKQHSECRNGSRGIRSDHSP